ncbi:MAG: carboxy terminal-processing peptidase [Flavobacteriales bacterium]|nr:carboxy terminal-processing peptidase [Flavobacteriales bacterium]
MKFKGIQLLLSTAAAILFCSYILYETSAEKGASLDSADQVKDKVLVDVLMQSLKSNHLAPRNIDDAFSKDVFTLYLERLDYNKRFLLSEDIDALKKFETSIDDQIIAGDYSFFNLSYALFMSRTKEAKEYYTKILEEPFDFSKKEFLELDEEKRPYLKTRKELESFWFKSLKYEALTRIHEMERKQEKASAENDTLTVMNFDEMEAKARKNMTRSNDRFFDRLEKWNREDLKEIYLNAVMNVFGPHTGYFPPKDKENFDISMSGQLEGIGAQLQEKDGYIKVVNIVPGSPSYLQGELEEGDLILKVAQEGGSPIDITDTRIDDAVKLIRGPKGTKVLLTVKKLNGLIKEIPIVRDVVVLAETYAKSAVIEENGVTVGYIRLPKFYADFNKLGGRSAAADVKTELLKLKAEGVDGVVLDLRGNGGGSLRDAIEMTGHFIENGPVVQVKGRFSRADIMRDNDKEVVYDGPLVVMMNHFSASASEILAAAIQDYDRGIIMGSNSSFGKGTVQRFYELDRSLNASYTQYRPLGAVKITTQKFYRINGGATQLRGVTSDIEFPTQYRYIDMGEKEQDFVMEWDEIQPTPYTVWKPSYSEKDVVKRSDDRIQASPPFMKIEENALRLKAQRDETEVSLNYEEFSQKQKELDAQEDVFDQMMDELDLGLKVTNVAADLEAIGIDSVKAEINERWIKKLTNDLMLDEAVQVIGDMGS